MPFLDRISGGLFTTKSDPTHHSLYADSYSPSADSTNAEGLAARSCGAAGCTSNWTLPWKNRRRPIFEGEWGCSARCLKTMARAAVRREAGESGTLRSDVPHRHRVPLGLVLLAQGWITHPQLRSALEAQKASGHGRVGDWLAQSCGLPEERITRGLGMQWSCPVLASDGFAPELMALVMPKRFVVEFGLLPLRVAGASLLYLAFQDRMNAAAAFAVGQTSGLKVESGLLDGTQFELARERLLGARSVPVSVGIARDADALTSEIVSVVDQKQPLASRLVRVHQYYWLRLWMESATLTGPGRLPSSSADVEDHIFMTNGTTGLQQ